MFPVNHLPAFPNNPILGAPLLPPSRYRCGLHHMAKERNSEYGTTGYAAMEGIIFVFEADHSRAMIDAIMLKTDIFRNYFGIKKVQIAVIPKTVPFPLNFMIEKLDELQVRLANIGRPALFIISYIGYSMKAMNDELHLGTLSQFVPWSELQRRYIPGYPPLVDVLVILDACYCGPALENIGQPRCAIILAAGEATHEDLGRHAGQFSFTQRLKFAVASKAHRANTLVSINELYETLVSLKSSEAPLPVFNSIGDKPISLNFIPSMAKQPASDAPTMPTRPFSTTIIVSIALPKGGFDAIDTFTKAINAMPEKFALELLDVREGDAFPAVVDTFATAANTLPTVADTFSAMLGGVAPRM